jgi:hypothetical protein
VNAVNLDREDEAVKRFFASLPLDAEGSLLSLGGHAFARIVPLAAGKAALAEHTEWTEALNNRRCELVDKEIEGTLTAAEAAELAGLQGAFQRYLRGVAPLPLDDARRLHRELLEKTRQANGAADA